MRSTPQRDAHASRDHVQPAPATNSARRRFLLALGAGTAGTAAAAAQAISPLTHQAGAVPAGQPQDRGYQETDHVRDYYASARI